MSFWSRPFVSVVIMALLASVPFAATAQGKSTVIVVDGDTVEIDGQPANLFGIDCPELAQVCDEGQQRSHCGKAAASNLEKILTLNRETLQCRSWPSEGPSDGPAASVVCTVGSEDVADAQLRAGYCLTRPGAFPTYLQSEQTARDAKLGIWGSDFVPPAEWRRGQRLPQ